MDRADSLTTQDASQKLEVFLGCRKLADLDFITVTDSYMVVTLQELNRPERTLLKTKTYYNNLNPDYAQTFTIDYFFEIRQQLKLMVYHEANPPKLVGMTEVTLGEVFGSPHNGLRKDLQAKNKKTGQVILRCEKVNKQTNYGVDFTFHARDIPIEHNFCFCFGDSMPTFFRIYRQRKKDELLIYESENIDGINPSFKKVQLSQRRLCKNNPDAPFDIRFYHYSITGNHQCFGTVQTSVNRIIDTRNMRIQDKHGNVRGLLAISQPKRYIKYSFMDYINSNIQLYLITCIDFTASNGSPKFPSSLHYTTDNKKSQYEQALTQVSKILLDYDSDKLVPVYGFGAKVHMPTFNSMGKVHHCFPLNGNQNNAHVCQLEGILAAYRQALQYMEFGGPTHFNALLTEAIGQARSLQKLKNHYMIIFILTDGEIHDKQQVIDQIIQCCGLPISIIIVGVGNGPFDIMNQLDDDGCELRDSRGNQTTRDLVQFVQFRKFSNNSIQLARQVLQQLPRQVQQYYQMMHITPNQFPKLPNSSQLRF